MKITVIGGSGLIGANLAKRLRRSGHHVLAASPRTGVDTISGIGLDRALVGTDVVVDVSNAPSFEDKAVLAFFLTSGRHVLDAAAEAGVTHHVALSVVGCDRLAESGYMRAKMAQENLIRGSGLPYTILRSTQFFEFMGSIIKAGTADNVVHLSPALMQPIAANDVAMALADLVTAPAINGVVEVAGPEPLPLDELARTFLAARGDLRHVVADVHARYFGAELNDRSLTPAAGPRLGSTLFRDWLCQAPPRP